MLLDAPQTIQAFLEGFNVPVYDENTVDKDASLPRLTYAYAEGDFENPVSIAVSVWDRSYMWTRVTALQRAIANAIPQGGVLLDYDGGKIWLKRGTPFAQRMSDENDAIRRIYINLEAEFLTAL